MAKSFPNHQRSAEHNPVTSAVRSGAGNQGMRTLAIRSGGRKEPSSRAGSARYPLAATGATISGLSGWTVRPVPIGTGRHLRWINRP